MQEPNWRYLRDQSIPTFLVPRLLIFFWQPFKCLCVFKRVYFWKHGHWGVKPTWMSRLYLNPINRIKGFFNCAIVKTQPLFSQNSIWTKVGFLPAEKEAFPLYSMETSAVPKSKILHTSLCLPVHLCCSSALYCCSQASPRVVQNQPFMMEVEKLNGGVLILLMNDYLLILMMFQCC